MPSINILVNIPPVSGNPDNNANIIDSIDAFIAGLNPPAGTTVATSVVTKTVGAPVNNSVPIVPPKTDEEMKDFVLKHSAELVESSVKSIIELQKITVATGDPEMMAGLASLIAANTTDPNTMYVVSGSNVTAGTSGTSGAAGAAGTSGTSGVTPTTFPFTGSAIISGSVIITGSAQGNVVAVSVASNTASIDLNAGNFFTVTLANNATTHFNVTGLNPGENANIFVTTGTVSTASFSSNITQPSGSSYLPSSGSGVKDVLSLVVESGTVAHLVNAKRFI